MFLGSICFVLCKPLYVLMTTYFWITENVGHPVSVRFSPISISKWLSNNLYIIICMWYEIRKSKFVSGWKACMLFSHLVFHICRLIFYVLIFCVSLT